MEIRSWMSKNILSVEHSAMSWVFYFGFKTLVPYWCNGAAERSLYVHQCYLWPRSLWWLWTDLFSACFCLCRFTLFLVMNLISIVSLLIYFHLFFFSLSFPPSPGQQEDEEDARGGTAGKERAGEDCEESSEEHEWPDLGRNKPLRFVSDTEGWD